MIKQLELVAFDGGNGTAAIKTENGEWTMPAVGRKLQTAGRVRPYKHTYTFGDGDKWLLGDPDDPRDTAAQIGNIPDRYYNGTTLRFLLALLRKSCPNETSIEIEELGMCLPQSVYSDTSNDVKIYDCFEREHVVTGTKVKIESVRLYGEGEVALYALPQYIREANTLIIDIGFSTTDVVLADKGSVEARKVLSYPLGIGELLADRKKIVANPKHYANRYEVQIEAEQLVSDLNRKYSKGQIDYVVVIGGGAYIYGEAIKEYGESFRGVLQNAQWLNVTDPELLNLRGMYA
jgi:hypothetical protein